MNKADIGVIGLAVMGENLVLNLESKGYGVAVYNRTRDKVDNFISGRGNNKKIIGTHSLKEFVENLILPRKILIMVKAGQPVDSLIQQLLPILKYGDIIIDGGNSNFRDTIRRSDVVEGKGMLYVGCGISGGELGALTGPSLMPGGSKYAWDPLKPIFKAIAAKTDEGYSCCEWIGDDGAGHFVKMVHNGIEYGDMQLISEAYYIMKTLVKLTNVEMSDIFADWNNSELQSYLIAITSEILAFNDDDGLPMIDKILDMAGQKGTGKWTGISALDLGVPLTLIGEAVFSRCLSSLKEERLTAANLFNNTLTEFTGDTKKCIENIRDALFAAKVVSYAQGFTLIRAAAEKYRWEINYGDIARIWRGGCIIRSSFLNDIAEAFDHDSNLPNLLIAPYFVTKLNRAQQGWRQIVATATLQGIPVPALSSALAYFDGYKTKKLPANLLQAQRDYFGAHMYERTDQPRGKFFHSNWTGSGGTTASSSYTV